MQNRANRRASLRTGDVARVVRESLRVVPGRIAMATVTAPGGEWSRAEVAEWNLGESKAWRRFSARLRSEMWRRHGEPPPRLLAWVAQRQGRGLDHLHLVFWCRDGDHERRIREWVVIYRELHLAYGFGRVDDPFHVRASRLTGKPQTMVFENPAVAGIYLGNYLAGGQLERFVAASDRSWRPYWISPALQHRAGWSLRRCHWVRQAWHMGGGTWTGRTWYGRPRYPSWWHDDSHRAWVCAVTGWDGVPGSRAGVSAGGARVPSGVLAGAIRGSGAGAPLVGALT